MCSSTGFCLLDERAWTLAAFLISLNLLNVLTQNMIMFVRVRASLCYLSPWMQGSKGGWGRV